MGKKYFYDLLSEDVNSLGGGGYPQIPMKWSYHEFNRLQSNSLGQCTSFFSVARLVFIVLKMLPSNEEVGYSH